MSDRQDVVYSAVHGTNADLIENVAKIYLRPGMHIADVTYGKGAFWKKVDLAQYVFSPTDLLTGVDFRDLPYEEGSLDVVVLDPPYMHDPGHPQTDYNAESTRGMGHDDIIELYTEGMKEAHCVLKVGGQLWVKCQDEIVSGKQEWSHIQLGMRAVLMGFKAQDLFVVMRSVATLQAKRQLHARKNHSYLWIFTKRKEED